eukprot:TRINITY_DN3236_c1_g9_i1.p1 TRINITY_DN3236_c1_g9~~TRINITY_DN3236_c1_g9_i1.p1  ORF type:complete len:579 (-),score=144.92 TRINITY_DN3236_c1_g9_i1:339-2075(-)
MSGVLVYFIFSFDMNEYAYNLDGKYRFPLIVNDITQFHNNFLVFVIPNTVSMTEDLIREIERDMNPNISSNIIGLDIGLTPESRVCDDDDKFDIFYCTLSTTNSCYIFTYTDINSYQFLKYFAKRYTICTRSPIEQEYFDVMNISLKNFITVNDLAQKYCLNVSPKLNGLKTNFLDILNIQTPYYPMVVHYENDKTLERYLPLSSFSKKSYEILGIATVGLVLANVVTLLGFSYFELERDGFCIFKDCKLAQRIICGKPIGFNLNIPDYAIEFNKHLREKITCHVLDQTLINTEMTLHKLNFFHLNEQDFNALKNELKIFCKCCGKTFNYDGNIFLSHFIWNHGIIDSSLFEPDSVWGEVKFPILLGHKIFKDYTCLNSFKELPNFNIYNSYITGLRKLAESQFFNISIVPKTFNVLVSSIKLVNFAVIRLFCFANASEQFKAFRNNKSPRPFPLYLCFHPDCDNEHNDKRIAEEIKKFKGDKTQLMKDLSDNHQKLSPFCTTEPLTMKKHLIYCHFNHLIHDANEELGNEHLIPDNRPELLKETDRYTKRYCLKVIITKEAIDGYLLTESEKVSMCL